jgi:hypothetical protein
MLVGWLLLWPLSYVLSLTPIFTWSTPEFTQDFAARFPGLHRLDIFIPVSTSGGQSDLSQFEPMVGLAGVLAIIAFGYFWGLSILHRRVPSRSAGQLVVGVHLLSQMALLLPPGLFASDLFSYLIYGRIAGLYGGNPYVTPPSEFPQDPMLSWVSSNGRFPSVYGPLWTWLCVPVTRLLDPLDPIQQTVAFKLFMDAIFVLDLAMVWWLAGRIGAGRRSPSARLTAFAVFAWNPLLLLELGGSAHNEVVVLTFVLISIVALAAMPGLRLGARESGVAGTDTGREIPGRHWAFALAMVGASALVKYGTGIIGLLYAVAWRRQFTSWPALILRLAVIGFCVLGAGIALFAPWLSVSSVSPMLALITGRGGLSDRRAEIARGLGTLVAASGMTDLATAENMSIAFLATLPSLMMAIYVGIEMWILARAAPTEHHYATIERVVRSCVRVTLLLAFLLVSLRHAWYFVVPVGLASVLGWQSFFVRVVVTLSILAVSDYVFLSAPQPWKVRLELIQSMLWILVPLGAWVWNRYGLTNRISRATSRHGTHS